MHKELWTPTKTLPRKSLPTQRKSEGGSYFDDELEDQAAIDERFARSMQELVEHLRQRPDHTVYVGSAEDRTKMRVVFNSWAKHGVLSHNPNIRIEYGIPEGGIRVDA